MGKGINVACTMVYVSSTLLFLLGKVVLGPDDGRMPYPFMGFNAWALEPGRGQPTEAGIIEICQALISTGLRDAGYVYVSPGEIGFVRNPVTHTLELEFPEHFTGGDLKHLSSWLHTNGFKFSNGISPGNSSCTGEVGVCGPRAADEAHPLPEHCHAAADAKWMVEQGSDHWPCDWCQYVLSVALTLRCDHLVLIRVIDHGACTISRVTFNPNPCADLVLTPHGQHSGGQFLFGVAIHLATLPCVCLPHDYQVHLQEQRVLLRRTLWSGLGRHPEHGAQHDVWHVRTSNCHINLDLSRAEGTHALHCICCGCHVRACAHNHLQPPLQFMCNCWRRRYVYGQSHPFTWAPSIGQ